MNDDYIRKAASRLLDTYELTEWNDEMMLAVYEVISGIDTMFMPTIAKNAIVAAIEAELDKQSGI